MYKLIGRVSAIALGIGIALIAWAGLETGTYISDLDASNPTSSDAASQGDDHLRLIKDTILNTFPNITGEVTSTHTELNTLDGITATVSELNILDGVTATSTELNHLDGVTAIDGGTYTPTVVYSGGGCTSTSSINSARYIRIDNIVMVSGTLLCSGASGGGVITLTLPVASNLSSSSHVAGNALAQFDDCTAKISADTAGNRAELEYASIPCTSTTYEFRYSFSYTIL